MMRRTKPLLAAAAVLLLFPAAPRPLRAATALVGGTVHPVSGPAVENAVIVFEDGKITALGPGAAPPAGATVVDVSGKHVYPGMIAAATVLGLVEISSVKGTDDLGERGNLNPNSRAVVAINPDSELIPVARVSGITTVLTTNVAPGGSGLITGISAVWNLEGWTWEEMAILEAAALHIDWPNMIPVTRWGSHQSDEEQAKQRTERLEALEQAVDDAAAYGKAREAMAAGGAPTPKDVRWEAMLPALRGEMPVFVHADEIQQIEAALDFARERELRLVLVGGRDAPRVADRLAAEDVPVVVERVLQTPRRNWEPYDAVYTVAARLHEAGVRFCITTPVSAGGAANLRNLPYEAAMAAAFGLPPEEALRAVTLYPARILGLGDRLGSLEVGKDANAIVTDGDPLEIRTRVLGVWIGGEEVSLESRHTRLYERYRNRPRTDGKPTRIEPSPAAAGR